MDPFTLYEYDFPLQWAGDFPDTSTAAGVTVEMGGETYEFNNSWDLVPPQEPFFIVRRYSEEGPSLYHLRFVRASASNVWFDWVEMFFEFEEAAPPDDPLLPPEAMVGQALVVTLERLASDRASVTLQVTGFEVVPEPGAVAFLVVGLGGLLVARLGAARAGAGP